ncbi:MAG: sensor histidine kinase [Streptosporangiaceae bacterium]|nr:sensor histidine kinase [Streptosporangiaceae bacterium]
MNRSAGHHRSTQAGRPGAQRRKRPIQATLAALIVIPLVSLVALWAFAAENAVTSAIAHYGTDTVDKDVGTVTEAVVTQVDTERADTYLFQAGHGLVSRANLVAQRAQTDAAISTFEQGLHAAFGDLPTASQELANVAVAALGQLPSIRAGVDSSRIAPLTAFGSYDAVTDAFFPFARSAALVGQSVSLSELVEGDTDESLSAELIAREFPLALAAMSRGGVMTAGEQRLFAQSVGQQRLEDQLGSSLEFWQQIPDPYTPLLESKTFAGLAAMEDQIIATAPGKPITVVPTSWNQAFTAVEAASTQAQDTALLGIRKGAAHAGDVILFRLVLVGVLGLIGVALSVVLLLGFGRRIAAELKDLRREAHGLAQERLPSVLGRLTAGADVDVEAAAPPLAIDARTREVAETADAFSVVRRAAIEAAVGQARLRKGVSNIFRSLARRNQSLLQRQLRMLDEMERETTDPSVLERLFQLDHLTTRMRRQAEGLIILSGAAPGRDWREPVPVAEMLNGAIGEIEDYVRVDMRIDSRDYMSGAVVADATHLLAELIENATAYSPPSTRVTVSGSRVARGYAIDIVDRGLGMPPELMQQLNERLSRAPEFDLASSDQLGLLVVSQLAARHGIKVSLRPSPYGGTAAVVLFPADLVADETQVAMPPAPSAREIRRARDAPTVPRNASEPTNGLPRRQRQAGIAWEAARPSAEAQSERSPERARSLTSAIQQGWRAGRATDDGGR